jgi:phosphinothricin acetyltransferase
MPGISNHDAVAACTRQRVSVLVRPAVRSDLAAICDIYNAAIDAGGSTFESAHRTAADIRPWLDDVRHPVLVAELNAQLAGWARIGSYRERECYAGVGDFSVYVDTGHRRAGVGSALLTSLIQHGDRLHYWKLIGRVFADNFASRELCRAAGFREVGVYERHGTVNGQWKDVVIVERLLAVAGNS